MSSLSLCVCVSLCLSSHAVMPATRAAELERAGLVRVQGREREGVLELAFKLARTLPGRVPDRTPGRGSGAPSHSGNGAHGGDTRQGSRQGSRQMSEKDRKNETPPQAPRASSSSAGPSSPGANGGGGGAASLVFPPGLATSAQERFARELEGVGQAQAVLDELGASIAAGTARHPVKLGLYLIGQARAGAFIPEHGPGYARDRERAARRARQLPPQDTGPASAPASREAARAALERARGLFRRRGASS
jgi:hypothetical protein